MMKKIKISLFDKKILKQFSFIVALISSIVGILAISISFQDKCRWVWLISWSSILILIYFILWIIANRKKKSKLLINGTKVNIYVGDIFGEKDGLKVIPVNEYFDTQIDDIVIAEKTLHGQYIKHHCKNIDELENLVKKKKDNLLEVNKSRKVKGHKSRYDLGTIVEYDGFLLTAFTRFDEKNQAYLLGKDYLYFWGSFWTNFNELYAGRSVYIPLFGSGITRFKDQTPTSQELLENILLSMRVTGFKNKYPSSSVNIVIDKDNANDIDFFHLKDRVGDK